MLFTRGSILHREGIDSVSSLFSLTPNETIIDPLNNTINSITGSGGVVVYPNIDGKYSDWGGVRSVCDMMRNFTSAGRQVSMVAINQSDWLCSWDQTGNKMGMYLQARALALYHDIAFEFAPSCDMIDNLVTWLPQSFLLGGGNDASNITGTIFAKSMRMSSDPCKCPRQPITHQCVDGWPHLAQLWHDNSASFDLREWKRQEQITPMVEVIHYPSLAPQERSYLTCAQSALNGDFGENKKWAAFSM
jgi:hypothetical protein